VHGRRKTVRPRYRERQASEFKLVAALFLTRPLNLSASTETYVRPGRSCPAPQLKTAGEMPLAVLCNRRPTMSAQIIKASVSLVEEARKLGADLLILGSHQHGALYRLWYGDIAIDAAKQAPCALPPCT
jgi:hypothetical protein